ncbi:MAG: hypothetical protein JSU65_08315 [Candidatus Zixiibacteriota bacterium]|nr:MAG: hypothetical protein JSU65_08315 [candidate division Zixibacteria bacterium]
MAGKLFRLILVAGVALSGLMCGGELDTGEQTARAVAYLPGSIDTLSVQQVSEARTFVGDSLWEYINGGAELYHLYGFVEVATADYRHGETEFIVDVYEFQSCEGAFGLFSSLRPPGSQRANFGVDGFSTSSSLDFVKGRYLIRITGFDATPQTGEAINVLAPVMAQLVPGRTDLPAVFGLFPDADAIEASECFIAEAFQGQSFLTDVYCRSYRVDEDSVVLFLTEAADKLTRWSNTPDFDGTLPTAFSGLTFDEGKAIEITSDFYGVTVVGQKGRLMAGVIGYHEGIDDFMNGWLATLQ